MAFQVHSIGPSIETLTVMTELMDFSKTGRTLTMERTCVLKSQRRMQLMVSLLRMVMLLHEVMGQCKRDWE